MERINAFLADGGGWSEQIRTPGQIINIWHAAASGQVESTEDPITIFAGGWIKAAAVKVFGTVGGFAARGGSYLVYKGLDAAGVVRYVGITGRAATVRFGEHLSTIGTGKELLRYRVIDGATGLSKTQAKIWEQTLINQYGLQKNGGLLLNKINSIAPN